MATSTTTKAELAFDAAIESGDYRTVATTLVRQAQAVDKASQFYAVVARSAFACIDDIKHTVAPTAEQRAPMHSVIGELVSHVKYTPENKSGFWKMLDRALRRVAAERDLKLSIRTADVEGYFSLVSLELPVKTAPAPAANTDTNTDTDTDAKRINHAIDAAFKQAGIDRENPPKPVNKMSQTELVALATAALTYCKPTAVGQILAAAQQASEVSTGGKSQPTGKGRRVAKPTKAA